MAGTKEVIVDINPIEQQLNRLTNEPSMNHRHRRIVQEALRVMKVMNEDLGKYREIEELFENNERLQRVLAEELAKA